MAFGSEVTGACVVTGVTAMPGIWVGVGPAGWAVDFGVGTSVGSSVGCGTLVGVITIAASGAELLPGLGVIRCPPTIATSAVTNTIIATTSTLPEGIQAGNVGRLRGGGGATSS